MKDKGSNPRGWDFFENEGTSEKGCFETEDCGTSIHFVLGFQENFMQILPDVLLFFGNKKNSKSSIFFQSLIIELLLFALLWLKFEEKIHTKAIVNVFREDPTG